MSSIHNNKNSGREWMRRKNKNFGTQSLPLLFVRKDLKTTRQLERDIQVNASLSIQEMLKISSICSNSNSQFKSGSFERVHPTPETEESKKRKRREGGINE